jgi:hypothetical protein
MKSQSFKSRKRKEQFWGGRVPEVKGGTVGRGLGRFPRAGRCVFAALSEEPHYARLPQILQSLRKEDTGFLCSDGHQELAGRLRAERKRIAVGYLNYLEDEFQLLLEASRILARIAPKVTPMGELERFKRNVRFVLSCRYLQLRLRLGLQPWNVFGTISDMEGDLTLPLETATLRLGERAAMTPEFPLFLKKGSGDSE